MRIGTISSIPIYLHWSFLGLLGLFAVWDLFDGGVAAMATTALLEGILFSSVLLHELGHALAARRYEIRTRDITLYPFGGVASLENMPTSPRAEMVVALAGPAVNVVLVALFATAWLVTGSWPLFAGAAINLVLGIFNLLPAYPMDGGRVLRAGLATRMGWEKASNLAMAIGRGFAWIFVAVAVVSGWWSLALVGAFLFITLRIEKKRLEWMLSNELAPRSEAVVNPQPYIASYTLRPR